MEECGLPLNENSIYYGAYWYSFGEAVADKVISGEITLPEAFVCSTDYIALGLMNRLVKHGIKVPGDVLVTGYDATAEAAFNDPTLTTFIPMTAHTAAEAVNMIAARIDPAEEKAKRIVSAVEKINSVAEKPYPISASIGYSHGVLASEAIGRLIPEADEMMYADKKRKKQNRV